jgi:hypothetical protein
MMVMVNENDEVNENDDENENEHVNVMENPMKYVDVAMMNVNVSYHDDVYFFVLVYHVNINEGGHSVQVYMYLDQMQGQTKKKKKTGKINKKIQLFSINNAHNNNNI